MEDWNVGKNETVVFAAVRSVFQYSIIPAFHEGFEFLKESYMANSKAAFGTLLTAFIVASPLLRQELDGTLKKIKESSTVTLGHLTSAPFSFPGPDKRPVGDSIDLCTYIASRIQQQLGINLKLNWVPVTTENRLEMVASGKVDIECGTSTASLSRQERVDFSLMTFVDGGGRKPLDGVVAYESAHIDGVASEKILRSGHSTQSHPETIEEVRRILREYLDQR